MLIALAPGIEEDDHRARVETVVDLVGVLQCERVHVDQDRHAARLGDHAGVVGNLFLLGRHEQHFHRAVGVGPVPGIRESDSRG